MSGGGGTSGKVDFPTHMKDIHQDWLGYSGGVTAVTTDMIGVMNNALGASGNPYDDFGGTLSYTDPSTDISAAQTIFDAWETMADAVDEETDWDSIIDNAVVKVDEAGVLNDLDISAIVSAARTGSKTDIDDAIDKAVGLLDDKVIMRAVENFKQRASFTRNEAMSRFSRQMAEINSVNSSAFFFGMALLEAQHMQDVNEFHSEVSTSLLSQGVQTYASLLSQQISARVQMQAANKQSRERLMINGSQVMASMLHKKVTYQQALAQVQAEIKRLKIVADAEYVANEADLNAKFAEWDFKVFQFGGQLLGSMGGGTALPERPSKVGSALGGALSGAAVGAQVGGPVGAGIGALLGAGAGLFS